MSRVPFVDLGAQYREIESEIAVAIRAVLEASDFILGSAVSAFEEAFAGFVGTKHAVGVGSGLDALRLALAGLGIGPGDEVAVPANSYVATALAVSEIGARPVLVDCDRTYTVAVDQMEAAATMRTRAVIPVHLAGQAAAMASILGAADRLGAVVVEDAAQAHGTAYDGRACGSLGVAGCFSFYPAKNLGAYGDAGLVTTDDDALAERLRRLRNYGERRKYEHVERGLNSRLDTLQAAVLQVKLRRLPAWNEARARHARAYLERLEGVGDLEFQERVPKSTHVYHLFVVETDDRDALRRHLAETGIATGVHYPTPIHLQEAYRDLGYARGAFPVAERLADRTLSLPMYPELTTAQIDLVADEVKAFFESRRRSRAAAAVEVQRTAL